MDNVAMCEADHWHARVSDVELEDRYYSRPRDWGAFSKKLPAAPGDRKVPNVYTKCP